MVVAYKNFLSLNTDEAVVASILRANTPKNVEVFMPLNAQLKDVDLVMINMKNKKSLSIQVKGSRGYEFRKSSTEFGSGSSGWFRLKKDVISKSTADFFILLVYVFEGNERSGRRIVVPHTITIATKKLKLFCRKYKKIGKDKMYNFSLCINPAKKEAYDSRDKLYHLDEYLDNKGFEELNKNLI